MHFIRFEQEGSPSHVRHSLGFNESIKSGAPKRCKIQAIADEGDVKAPELFLESGIPRCIKKLLHNDVVIRNALHFLVDQIMLWPLNLNDLENVVLCRKDEVRLLIWVVEVVEVQDVPSLLLVELDEFPFQSVEALIARNGRP